MGKVFAIRDSWSTKYAKVASTKFEDSHLWMIANNEVQKPAGSRNVVSGFGTLRSKAHGRCGTPTVDAVGTPIIDDPSVLVRDRTGRPGTFDSTDVQ